MSEQEEATMKEFFEWKAIVDRYWGFHSTVAIAIAGYLLTVGHGFETPDQVIVLCVIVTLELLSFFGLRDAYLGYGYSLERLRNMENRSLGWPEKISPHHNLVVVGIHCVTLAFLTFLLFRKCLLQ